jgi:hypothetical protein
MAKSPLANSAKEVAYGGSSALGKEITSEGGGIVGLERARLPGREASPMVATVSSTKGSHVEHPLCRCSPPV